MLFHRASLSVTVLAMARIAALSATLSRGLRLDYL